MVTRTSTVEITMPQMGESVTEGTVLEWRKQVGDRVEADEPLLDVSTDKVDTEIPSPVSGTLTSIAVEPDQTVAVGAVLGEIEPGDAPLANGSGGEGPAEPPPIQGNGGVNVTPVAARMAGEHGVDLSALSGTGPRGKVTKDDVRDAIEGNGSASSGPLADAETQVIRGPAATLVRFMNESRSIPTATSFRTLPVTTLDARRRALKNAGRKLSFTHLIAWAIVKAAGDWPVMGHSYGEADGKPSVCPRARSRLGWPWTWSERTAPARWSCRCSTMRAP